MQSGRISENKKRIRLDNKPQPSLSSAKDLLQSVYFINFFSGFWQLLYIWAIHVVKDFLYILY